MKNIPKAVTVLYISLRHTHEALAHAHAQVNAHAHASATNTSHAQQCTNVVFSRGDARGARRPNSILHTITEK